MSKYDLYIFDLDGTVINSGQGIAESMRYSLNKLGYSMPSEDVFNKIIGPPLLYSMEHILNVKKDDFEEVSKNYREHFKREGYKFYKVYTGVRLLFNAIKLSGAKIALATSKPITPTTMLLKHLGLFEYFDSINAPASDVSGETKSQVVANAIKTKHSKAVLIGDRKYDAKGASDNNIDFVGVSYGFGTNDELVQTQAIHIVSTPRELINIFKLQLPKGKFISIEGMDGCGKTTQVELLNKKLKQYGFDFILTREPGGTKISESIRDILLSNDNFEMHPITEALLYAASRAQHVQELIKPTLNSGKNVICDRYVDSSIAYQGGGRELGTNNISLINSFAIDELLPYKTIYLSMDRSKAMQRRTAQRELDRLEIEKDDFFVKTQQAFDNLINNHKDRFIVINADDTLENISNSIFKSAVKALEPNINW